MRKSDVLHYMRQQKQGRPYSHFLRHILAAQPHAQPLHLPTPVNPSPKVKRDLLSSMQQLQESRKKYDHQIDHLVKELAHQQGLPVELPFLQRKSSYHNYRILSHPPHGERQGQQEGENQWRKRVLPELQKQGRTRTEPKQYELSTERDRVYSIVKHYRQGSLKKMDLHLNMDKLKRWHNHHRDLAIKREAQTYKMLPKQPFYQLQLH